MAGAFGVGLALGVAFALTQSPKDLPKLADGNLGTSANALLAASPTLAGAVVVLTAAWVALRAAGAAQLRQAKLAGEEKDPRSERVAGAQAWADIESIASFFGFGFVLAAVVGVMVTGTGTGITSLLLVLFVLIVVRKLYLFLMKRNVTAAERSD